VRRAAPSQDLDGRADQTTKDAKGARSLGARGREASKPGCIASREAQKKPRTMPGLFLDSDDVVDQYLATTGPDQLKR
jgi:hypothetical protein